MPFLTGTNYLRNSVNRLVILKIAILGCWLTPIATAATFQESENRQEISPTQIDDQPIGSGVTAIHEFDGDKTTSSRTSPFTKASVQKTPSSDGFTKIKSDEPTSKETFESAKSRFDRWPTPEAILKKLELLRQTPLLDEWVQETVRLFDNLEQNEGIRDRTSLVALEQLGRKVIELDELSEKFADPAVAESLPPGLIVEMRRLKYCIQRRLDVWYLVHQLAVQNYESIGDIDRDQMQHLIQVSSSKVSFESLDPGWSNYLKLDEASKVFNALSHDEVAEKKTAREILARYHSPVLNPKQREFLEQAIAPELGEFLRIKARGEMDLGKMLHQIEYFENTPSGTAEYLVNDHYQNLLWSDNHVARELAGKLHIHYRNANFRVSISEQLMNRLVPELPDSQEPVSENILGAKVFGQSQISNQLKVRMIPDPNHVHLSLETSGRVRSRTLAQKSGFTVHNEGNTRYQVVKKVAIGGDGVWSDQPVAVSSTNNRMLGIRGKLDPIPVIGWMARRIAQKQIDAQQPAANQFVRQKLESSAESRMEEQVDTQLNELREFMFVNLTQPLISMELEPAPVQMATTENELVMRYRIAGRDQLAANTSRPRAAPSSLVSIQAHQSLINNLMMRIELAGESFTPVELVHHLQAVLGTKEVDTSELEEIDAELQFQRFDPIRLDFNDDKITIELNFKKLRVKNSVWKNLSVTCAYVPKSTGLKVELTQAESGIQLTGKALRLRDRAAVLAIFGELFEQEYSMSTLTPEFVEKMGQPDVTISQFTVDNGWIGISISDATPVEQAESAANQNIWSSSLISERVASGDD